MDQRQPENSAIPAHRQGPQPIQKNFFNLHDDIKNRSEEDVSKFMKENEVKVEGSNIPRPVQTFKESSLPKYLVDQLSSSFEKPSVI